jgi:TolB-like protein/cytochrome c-type biogenesis protein CcmH/NrfG
MSFFEELKRRNVFKVGLAYAVGAWLLLQLTEVLSELLSLPPTIGPVVVSVVAIGFPIVLFFAWAFELTPEGVKREAEVDRTQSIAPQTGRKLNHAIVVMLSLAVVYLLYDKFSGNRTELPATAQTAAVTEADAMAAPPPEIDRKSIAVLPFDNRSRDIDDEFFVEGVHDDLLTNLARIGDLKVISRTSVLRYKDTERPIPEIARELGVATVMEGAVQRSGNTIRINVQLIDANTDEHLWAEIFDREMTAENLFAIQSEISQKIAGALQATLSPEEQQRVSSRPTDNLEAYDAYLRGRRQMARRTSESVEQAAVEFQRAVELDPEFALAWAAMAENTRWLINASTMPIPEAFRIREMAANRALEINPELGEAYIALAGLDMAQDKWADAEAKMRKAIELSPGFAEAYDWYSDLLAVFPNRRKEALAMARKAEELDPMSPEIQTEIGEQLQQLGRYESAEQQLRRVIQLNPDFVSAYGVMASLMQDTGRFDEQMLWLKRAEKLDPGNIQRYMQQAWALLDMDDRNGMSMVREKMLEIDDQHFSVGLLEAIDSISQGRYESAIESGRWVEKQIGDIPNFQDFFGWTYVFNGEYAKARDAFAVAYPEYFDRETWRKGLEKSPYIGCYLAWVSQRANAGDPMTELVNISLAYLENELPLYIDHADRYNDGACYMMTGDHEKALEALETGVAHGHYTQWWLFFKTPIFEPLFGDPRFEALLQQVRDQAAQQRANWASMEAQLGA